MPSADEINRRRRSAAKLVLAHQLISEVYHDTDESVIQKKVQDAGLSLSDVITMHATREELLLDMDTFERFRDSEVLESGEFNELVELSLQQMYPDGPAD